MQISVNYPLMQIERKITKLQNHADICESSLASSIHLRTVSTTIFLQSCRSSPGPIQTLRSKLQSDRRGGNYSRRFEKNTWNTRQKKCIFEKSTKLSTNLQTILDYCHPKYYPTIFRNVHFTRLSGQNLWWSL